MGLPFWEMPDGLSVGGCTYPINTDFRVGIRVRQMFWEPYYQTRQNALIGGIRRLLFFDAPVGQGAEDELLCRVLWYLLDGRMTEERLRRRLRGDGPALSAAAAAEGGEAVFSYLWDIPAVYAAFLAEYRVDLLTAQLHLWQFDALFASLPDTCTLRRTMALRASDTDDIRDDAARAQLAAQKLSVRIPAAEELYAICDGQRR